MSDNIDHTTHSSGQPIPASPSSDKQPSAPAPDPDAPQPGRHIIRPTWLRRVLKTLMWIAVILLLIPPALYIPPVQTFVKDVACKVVKKSTGMDISISRFSLRFPLKANLEGVTVLDQGGDTMVSARSLLADIKLLPLLKLDVKVNSLRLLDGYYRMVSPDSSMILTLRAGLLDVDGKSSLNIAKSDILLNEAKARNGRVNLYMNVWKQKPTPPDSTSTPFLIRVNKADLENFDFNMSMLPTIDTLSLRMGNVALRNGIINLRTNRIDAEYLGIANGSATYITPTPEYIASHPMPVPDTVYQTAPFTIRGDSVALDNFKAIYAIKGAKPLPGFDPSYMSFSDIFLGMRGFYNQQATVKLPITRLQARERSGLKVLAAQGRVNIDSTGLELDAMRVRTANSRLHGNMAIPFALMELKPEAPVSFDATASIGIRDAELFMPDLSKYTANLPHNRQIDLAVKANGTLSNVEIPQIRASMPGVFSLDAKGNATNPLDIKKMKADIAFDASLADAALANRILDNKDISVPAFSLKGTASADRQEYAADFTMRSTAGDIVGKGHAGLNSERYFLDASVSGLEVSRIMPSLGVGIIDATIYAKGAGFNPTRPGAATEARIEANRVDYQGHSYRGILASASLNNGDFEIHLASPDPYASLTLTASGHVAPDLYSFDAKARINALDLQKLGFTPDLCNGHGDIDISGTASPEKWLYDVDLDLRNFDWNLPDNYIHLPQGAHAKLLATSDNVDCTLTSHLTRLHFSSPASLKAVSDGFMAAANLAPKQMEQKQFAVDELLKPLPSFNLKLDASGRGLIRNFLEPQGMAVDTLFVNLQKDSLLTGNASVRRFTQDKMRLDTITLTLGQRRDLLDYRLHLGNRAGNLDDLHSVNLNGYIGKNRLSAFLNQKNLRGQTGYRLGFTAALQDSLLSVHFTPAAATIAYMPWEINLDNAITYNLRDDISANIKASSNNSSIEILTNPDEKGRKTLFVNLDNLRVQDFLKMSIYAPPLTASVDSHLRLRYIPGKRVFVGSGDLGVKDFSYDKVKVPDFKLNLRAGLDSTGNTAARAGLLVGGHEAMILRGVVRNDSTDPSPLRLNFILDRFPLSMANAFLGKDVAQLSGTINGKMTVRGGFASPMLNGAIRFDSAAVDVGICGSKLRLDTVSIPVDSNMVRFNDFEIFGLNSNPLTIDGAVDARKFNKMRFDLAMKARNFQLVGNDKRAGTTMYGKLFFNLDGKVKGPMDHFDINANLRLLKTTDIYYNIPMAAATINRTNSGDVVKFVQFNDTVQKLKPDSVENSMAMRIIAGLTIDPGTRACVNLSASNTDRVELSPSGTLNYFQNFMGDMRLNGTLTLGEGFARYNVPVMGEKKFDFEPQSTITFTGDIMNPSFNIQAYDNIKANVTPSGGNSRLITFRVGLSVTNNLAHPKILFDLSTKDDMSVQNELQSMSADQRSNQAMNLLLYGQYTGPGMKGNANTSNPLYGFLESQINSWAANNIRGIDLSFGIDQYNTQRNGRNSNTTSYSYQLSKSLFSNKFKIVVGGNYSTDASADENFSQNLINDIAFEYTLRQTSSLSMSLKLFRHTGYESILEGEITETGVAFVMRRQLENLKRLFRIRFGRNKKREASDTTLRPDAIRPDSVILPEKAAEK